MQSVWCAKKGGSSTDFSNLVWGSSDTSGIISYIVYITTWYTIEIR